MFKLLICLSWRRVAVSVLLAVISAIAILSSESYYNNLELKYIAEAQEKMFKTYPCTKLSDTKYFFETVNTGQWHELLQKCSINADAGRIHYSLATRLVFLPYTIGYWGDQKVTNFLEDNNERIGNFLEKFHGIKTSNNLTRCEKNFIKVQVEHGEHNGDSLQEYAKTYCADQIHNLRKVLALFFVILPFMIIIPCLLTLFWLTGIFYLILSLSKYLSNRYS